MELLKELIISITISKSIYISIRPKDMQQTSRFVSVADS
jgi:hypothetical protein